MFLDTIILVLTESIEAGALLSLLLCISNQHKTGLNWLWFGLPVGTFGAVLYAFNFSIVGEWFEYAGQEAVNAVLLSVISTSLMTLSVLLIFAKMANKAIVNTLLFLAISCAIARELTEVVMFYIGFIQSEGDLIKAITSGFIGFTIGISFGVLYYYLINIWRQPISRIIQIGLLTLISAGMMVQAVQLLIQVDWINSTKPLWDSNWLLAESSIAGQMTYAIFGYEATPSLPEVTVYSAIILSILLISCIHYLRKYKETQ